jgi:hypothetical protein
MFDRIEDEEPEYEDGSDDNDEDEDVVYNTNFDIYTKDKLIYREVKQACFAGVRSYLGNMTHLVYFPQLPVEDTSAGEEYIGMKYRDLQHWYLNQMNDFGFPINPFVQVKSLGQDDPNPHDYYEDALDGGFVIYKKIGIRQVLAEATIIRHIQENPSILFAFYEMLRLYPALAESPDRRFAAFGVACAKANPLGMPVFNDMVEVNNDHSLFPYSNQYGDIYGINTVKELLSNPKAQTIFGASTANRLKEAELETGQYYSYKQLSDVKSQIEWIITNVK